MNIALHLARARQWVKMTYIPIEGVLFILSLVVALVTLVVIGSIYEHTSTTLEEYERNAKRGMKEKRAKTRIEAYQKAFSKANPLYIEEVLEPFSPCKEEKQFLQRLSESGVFSQDASLQHRIEMLEKKTVINFSLVNRIEQGGFVVIEKKLRAPVLMMKEDLEAFIECVEGAKTDQKPDLFFRMLEIKKQVDGSGWLVNCSICQRSFVK